MSGKNGEALNHLVDQFNQEQKSKIKVEAVFAGKYAEALTKLKAAIQSKQTPTISQVFEVGTQIMVDTKAVIPYQDLMAKYGGSIDDIEPGIASYYTVDGKLQSMPFNASAPVLYYNKDAFTKAGLDPDKPPTTWDELLDAAQQLTIKNGSETAQYGMVASIDGWLVEQMLAAGGVQYCDNDNGRSGRATKVNWETPELKAIVSGWADGVKSGDILNVGRNNTDAAAAFQAGRAAMIPFTSANLRDMFRDSKFQVGVANYVRPPGTSPAGVFNGGASIWTMAAASEDQQRAASEFLKYLGTPASQAYWSTATGYIAVNPKAAGEKLYQDTVKDYPAFTTPAKELAATKSVGCLMGAMPQARDKMNDIVESVINGSSSVDDAISKNQEAADQIIADYNSAVA
jgi:sn-glycerol 3-phosphate transport system substrate-binding protein